MAAAPPPGSAGIPARMPGQPLPAASARMPWPRRRAAAACSARWSTPGSALAQGYRTPAQRGAAALGGVGRHGQQRRPPAGAVIPARMGTTHRPVARASHLTEIPHLTMKPATISTRTGPPPPTAPRGSAAGYLAKRRCSGPQLSCPSIHAATVRDNLMGWDDPSGVDDKEAPALDYLEAIQLLRQNGYTFTEAWQLLRYVAEEHRSPSSRAKATRLHKAEAALREVGIDPAAIDLDDFPPVQPLASGAPAPSVLNPGSHASSAFRRRAVRGPPAPPRLASTSAHRTLNAKHRTPTTHSGAWPSRAASSPTPLAHGERMLRHRAPLRLLRFCCACSA